MAVYITINEVCRQIRDKGAKFWKISSGDESAILARMIDDKCDIETSIAELRECYNEMSGDWVKIKANTQLIEGRGGDTRSSSFEWRVRCKNNTDKDISNRVSDPLQNNAMFSLIINMMKEHNEAQRKFDAEMSDIKTKLLLKELEAKSDNNNSQYMAEGIGLLKNIMLDNYSDNQGIAGIEKPSVASNFTKIKASIKILNSIDKNFATNLEGLAKLAQKDPGQYYTAVKYLNALI